MKIPLIGNCYCWAYLLKLWYGGEVFSICRELGPKGQNVKHYMLKKPNGRIVHFKRMMNVFPTPFQNLIFVGIIETSGRKKHGSN